MWPFFREEGLDVVVNLGDSINGKYQDEVCKITGGGGKDHDKFAPGGNNPSIYMMDTFLSALLACRPVPIIKTNGNHYLYNLDRKALGDKLSIPFVEESTEDLVGYHTHLLTTSTSPRQLHIVVLDAYDVSI